MMAEVRLVSCVTTGIIICTVVEIRFFFLYGTIGSPLDLLFPRDRVLSKMHEIMILYFISIPRDPIVFRSLDLHIVHIARNRDNHEEEAVYQVGYQYS